MISDSFLNVQAVSFNPNLKPQLSSLQKVEAPSNTSYQQQLEYFFRYHIVSLIKGCKKNCYDHKSGKGFAQRHSNTDTENNETALLNSLSKLVLVKSKYRHRQRINFNRCQALKYLKYSLEQLRSRVGSKQYNQLYEDLFDELCPEDKKQEQREAFKADPNFTLESFKAYRKKHNLSPNTKIFIVPNYEDLSRYLLDAGWHCNTDSESLIYDFKYITKGKLIDHTNQKQFQVSNHFEKNGSITTKYGLCRNIKNLILEGEDFNTFYPRCFDLYDVAEFQDWVEEFKFSKVVAILKSALEIPEQELAKNNKLLTLCLDCGRRYGLSLSKKIMMIQSKQFPIVSAEQWNYICNPTSIPQKPVNQHQPATNLLQNIKAALKEISKVDAQFNMNKQNIWIVKPGSRSRGRGIKAFSDLKQIIDYVAGKDDICWVVQKYLENPLIIKNRKFDIRQWVVVTDLKPLRIWAYKQFYARFSAEQYSTANIKNRFAHLTNNSIAKHSQSFDNEEIKGNMYFEQQLAQVITETTDDKSVFPSIKEQMLDNIAKSLRSVSDMLSSKKNSIEMFGYDFMIDTDMRSWLIEVNSSPSMDYSTHVTSKLVPEALKGFGKLVTEYVMGDRQVKEEIGGWKLIYNK